ncbi:unnamed protein product [Dibothriocephalus latus]|uniref:RNA transcription, translation and transport factor protein n=1 Tax=Dibothriocephalus latus TaxID=60516 RepID=A0A3P7LSV8_DIBLA|nr:unnamed protein product [Dibothriocephalus latus]
MSTDMILKRKLVALGYPIANEFSSNSVTNFRNVLVWLEDRVIRALPISDRFRDTDSDEWAKFEASYLSKLGCPFISDNAPCALDWVMNRGLELQSTEEVRYDLALTMEAESEVFKTGVQKLAKLLRIPSYADPKQTFKAICLLIEQKLSEEAIQQANDEQGEKIDMLTEKEVCLGFDVTDPQVHAAAVALRLMHCSELRQLQNQINSAIVQVQRLTADPKTDEKLGKVGF